MPITKTERDRLAALPQDEKNTSIKNDIAVIHRSINSGTVDRDTVNFALARIAAAVEYQTPVAGTPKPLGTPHATV